VKKAEEACRILLGDNEHYRFGRLPKSIAMPKGAKREIADFDFRLSRRAVFMVVKGCDQSMPQAWTAATPSRTMRAPAHGGPAR
jgi:hypothetical protein